MPWPVPTAKTLAERLASSLEAGITSTRPLVDPLAISRAVRSARGMLASIGRAVALELRQVHDHVAWWGRQYFVDTAEDEFVLRHAAIWGVEQRAATSAVGAVLIEGIAGTALPAGLEMASGDGTLFVTTAVAVIQPGGSVLVEGQAAVAGTAGNIEAGVRLRTVTAFPAINRITVDGDGFAGGAAEETPAELAIATQAYIRQRPHGGAAFDYLTWLRAQFSVRTVQVYTDWIGRGSVGVVVVMKDGVFGRSPTVAELAAMLDYLGAPGSSTGVRPVTAYVVLVPAVVNAIAITVRLRPDTVATRQAVTDAWSAFVATIGDENDEQNTSPIGATIERSRISEALSAAAGEYAHDLISPADRIVLDRDEYPVPGMITFADPL